VRASFCAATKLLLFRFQIHFHGGDDNPSILCSLTSMIRCVCVCVCVCLCVCVFVYMLVDFYDKV
jgi:hypothetical protein